MWFRILASLVLFSLVTACAPLKSKKKKPAPAPPPPVSQRKSPTPAQRPSGPLITVTWPDSSAAKCTTKDDKSIAPERKVQRQTINVKMEKQRVIRKNCEGQVVSDGMEKVTSPVTEIILTPVRWWSNIGGSAVAALNRTTCSGPGAELEKLLVRMLFGQGVITSMLDNIKNAAGFPRLRFSVDTSPTISSMHVRKNQENYIDYEFAYCAEREKLENGVLTDNCKKIESVEKGTLILIVNYTENSDIGGVKEVQEPCPPPKPPENPPRE